MSVLRALMHAARSLHENSDDLVYRAYSIHRKTKPHYFSLAPTLSLSTGLLRPVKEGDICWREVEGVYIAASVSHHEDSLIRVIRITPKSRKSVVNG